MRTKRSRSFEIALVLVRLDHIACIVNANHSIISTTATREAQPFNCFRRLEIVESKLDAQRIL
jgi:hypothetical protein